MMLRLPHDGQKRMLNHEKISMPISGKTQYRSHKLPVQLPTWVSRHMLLVHMVHGRWGQIMVAVLTQSPSKNGTWEVSHIADNKSAIQILRGYVTAEIWISALQRQQPIWNRSSRTLIASICSPAHSHWTRTARLPATATDFM